MATFFTVLIAVVCLLLILVVLVQNPKGGGLASGFSGANQIGGVKRTTDFLEKSTWTLVIVLMLLSIASSSFMKKEQVATGNQNQGGELEELMESQPTQTPQQPGQPQQQPQQQQQQQAPAENGSGEDLPIFDDEEEDQE